MLDALSETWSRPYKIVRVMQALGMEVPKRLRRERLALLRSALAKGGLEASLADGGPLSDDESPGIEAKIRLRRVAGPTSLPAEFGYEVVTPIPSGGMAQCFKVRASDGAFLFLKKVPLVGVHAAAIKRETEIYSKLQYASAEHVVRVHDLKQTDDHLGLVMDFADGGTLEEHCEPRGKLSPGDAKPLALAVLQGLQELHSLNIVHRDLKPQNVLCSGGQWKLADFGISKNLSRLVTVGPTFQRMGTPGYTAPEQWQGREAHTSSDVYSFGKLLVFLLTGETDIDHLFDHPGWATLARRCVALEPSERPTVADISLELGRL